jgi:hypothetical protein
MANHFDVYERVFKPVGKDKILIDRLVATKRDFVLRKTKYYTSLIYDGIETIYPSKDKDHSFPPNQMWLFNSVKRDALKFIENNPNLEIPNKLPTNATNIEYDATYGAITGTDIESAYWTIAFKLGILSESTYEKANAKDFKMTKLASLAILGRVRAYHKYENGEKVKEPIIIQPDHDKLKDIYRIIRFSCYMHMGKISQLLGKDFEAYRTDCIYYRDSIKNRNKVYDYLQSEGFSFKQLIYDEEVEK